MMMKNRILSMLLCLCMLVTFIPAKALEANPEAGQTERLSDRTATDANPFQDISETDWFFEAIQYAARNNIFSGTGANTFSPYGTMTRAMFVTVMGRIAGMDPAACKGNSGFADVPDGAWYAPYVVWAVNKGITNGIGNGAFGPDDTVSREQMAVFTVRYFESAGIDFPEESITTEPADFDQIEGWAAEAVMKLWRTGLFQGDSQGRFNPKQNATRAEAASFTMRVNETQKAHLARIEKEQKEKDEKTTAENPANPTDSEDKEPGKETGSASPNQPPKDSGNEQENTNPGGADPGNNESNSCTVTFMDGANQLDSLSVEKGQPLTQTPSAQKTAKDGYIFTGWFNNSSFTTPFYAEDPVTANMTVYAKYEKVVKEELTLTSFAQLDQSPGLSFVIQKTASSGQEIEDSLILSVMDGTDPVELAITDNGDGTYTVKAKEGFREGSSYELTLADGCIFKDKAETIRTASFTIKKEEVDNLGLREDLIYIQDTEAMTYTIDSTAPVDVLEAALMNSKDSEAVTGTFEYPGANTLKPSDILCIYETVDPRQRDYVNGDYSDDTEAYIEVTGISGNTVSFTSMDETDAEKVIFIPDTIPFSVAALPTGSTGTVQTTAVDNAARIEMSLDINPAVEKGDYVVFYVGAFAELTEEAQPYYGVVTGLDGDTIAYQQTTREEIEKSMDTFLQQTQKGDELLEGVDTQALIHQIEEQVKDSGFAENAAEYLAMMATQTDGFKSLGLSDFSITDENGNDMTAEELKLMGIGANIELSDKVKVTVELDKSSKYFKDGIRLALGIDAEFSVEGEDEELKIDLSATFVEEIAVDISAGAHAKIKWYFFIPKFKELSFRTAVDLKNYAGISVDVKMYTVEPEDESVWDKLKGIKGGQYKQVFEQIEEVKSKIDQAKETVDKLQDYREDLERLWASIPGDVTNKSEYEGMLDTLGELNVTQELMEMMNLTSETELDAGVRNLMERYSEMLENESDWIEILNKEIFHMDIPIKIFAIGIGANFVVKGNVNIALGANMEYVVGKRYSFWFDIVSKTSGSSEMDLLDEKFAFQFYVMGKLGLKMGIEAEIAVGIISTKIGSIGVTAEFGPYVEMWGYFIYEYTKLRPANTSTWTYDEKMIGALYLEFGLYLEITFKAQALGLFKYEPTLLDKKWPLLTAGTRNNVYDFAYEIEADEVLPVTDMDGNGSNGITMILPESYRQMEYMDLCEGDIEQAVYPLGKYHYSLTNRNFGFDPDTGIITVTAPNGVRYMECELTLTWQADKLVFSKYDISVTIPLIWTNLSTEELKQRFAASVRAGNQEDGYKTVWSTRVMKNKTFDLPTADEIKELLGVDSYETDGNGNLKYSAVTGYGDQQTEGLSILRDENYYFEVTPRTYTLTVKDVENPDGSKADRQFTAKFGEAFNISTLVQSGTNDDAQHNYTSFLKVLASDSQDEEILRNVTEPIGKAFAMDLLSGSSYTAVYMDNSATATFNFEGVDLEPVTVKMKKGDVPTTAFFADALNDKNALVKNIKPAFAPIMGATSYTVECAVQALPVVKHAIQYNTNGGSAVGQMIYPVGSAITAPAAPVKAGYDFRGWYRDVELTQAFAFTTMPDEDITLYAGWIGKPYTVSFDVNEGNPWAEGQGTKNVTFGEAYDNLPVPVRPGFGFDGWYTVRTAGDKVTAETMVERAENHTLYAHWIEKADIDETTVSFEANQSHDYNEEHHAVVFSTGDSGIEPGSFTVKYKRQNLDNSWGDTAINAGTYDVQLTRDEDDVYKSFEYTFTSVMTINKIARTIQETVTGSVYKANVLIDEWTVKPYPGDGILEYAASAGTTAPEAGWQASRAIMNLEANNYYLFARVLEGENYLTSESVRSESTVTVEGIAPNSMGYVFGMNVKTSDIDKAGTDSSIYGQFIFADGSTSTLTHFDNDGNDFEQDDSDNYIVNGVTRDPWMIDQLKIHYDRSGSAPGWHCEYVKPCLTKNVVNFIFSMDMTYGEAVSVNQWFGAEENDQELVDWTGSTGSMKRRIESVGNFQTMTENLELTAEDTDSFAFSYDGQVMDQYALDDTPYNAYDHNDAPVLTLTSEDTAYSDCISHTIYSFNIDQAALYAAMEANGDTEITLTATLQFPERSTTPETARWTKTITVRLAD